MKFANIRTENGSALAAVTERGVVNLSAAGCGISMRELIAGAGRAEAERLAADMSLPTVENPVYANVVEPAGKLLCVGLNYRQHAISAGFDLPVYPVLFSKFADALVPEGAAVELPPWEISYDYEAELVVVIGKSAWGISEEEAMDCVFGYTCGNDLSCRDSQMRSGQWLIGKTMPGFGPCGPVIVTKDEFDAAPDHFVRSYVNGELRQDGLTSDMIFSTAQIVSYASRYMRLEPGDLIFTGTPSGVALEKKHLGDERWLKPGDTVDIAIEGIGVLHNRMC